MANNPSLRATIGVATGFLGFNCTASKTCCLEGAQHAACTMRGPPI
jgi:hypothetical protein